MFVCWSSWIIFIGCNYLFWCTNQR